MLRNVTAIAAIGLFAGAASAEFIGIEIREDKSVDPTAFPTVPDTARVFNVYALFDGDVNDSAANTVVSVGDSNITAASDFYQSAGNGDLPPFDVFAGTDTDLDTFMGLGAKQQSFASPAPVALDPDFSIVGDTLTGGWFTNNPPALVGAPTFNSDTGQFETFIAQLSLVDATGLDVGFPIGFDGEGNFEWATDLFRGVTTVFRQGVGEEPGAIGINVEFVPIPGPGALALFGVAGVAAARRRR